MELNAKSVKPAPGIKIKDVTVFAHKEFDVTNSCAKLCSCGMASSMLVLEADEVFLRNEDCCGSETKRMPYGEIGSVDQRFACGCWSSFNAGGLAPGVDGAPGQISPGCGCEKGKVSEIVEELNQRQRQRGDVAQMKRADEQAKNIKIISDRMNVMEAKMDAIMEHLEVPQQAVMVREICSEL